MDNNAPIAGEDGRRRCRRTRRAEARRATTFTTLEEAERAKHAVIMRPNFMAAANLRAASAELQQLASAGVTTVLAAPSRASSRARARS